MSNKQNTKITESKALVDCSQGIKFRKQNKAFLNTQLGVMPKDILSSGGATVPMDCMYDGAIWLDGAGELGLNTSYVDGNDKPCDECPEKVKVKNKEFSFSKMYFKKEYKKNIDTSWKPINNDFSICKHCMQMERELIITMKDAPKKPLESACWYKYEVSNRGGFVYIKITPDGKTFKKTFYAMSNRD